MRNYRARLGRGSGPEEGFLWGNYDLSILYRKFDREKESTAERTFVSSFSAFLDTSSYLIKENPVEGKKALTCEARYSVSVAPLLFTLFPLLAKLGYLPFRITVDVFGDVYAKLHSAPLEQEGDRQRSSQPEFYRARAEEQTQVGVLKMKEKKMEAITETAGEEEKGEREKKDAAAKGLGVAAGMAKETRSAAGAREKQSLQAAGGGSIYLEKIYQMMGEGSTEPVPREEDRTTKGKVFAAPSPAGVSPKGQDLSPGATSLKSVSPGIAPHGTMLPSTTTPGVVLSKTSSPGAAPHSRYYNTYRLFYDYFFPGTAAEEIPYKGKRDKK